MRTERRLALWTLVAITAIVIAIYTAISYSSDNKSFNIVNAIAISVSVVTLLAAFSVTFIDRGRASYRKIRISLVGAPMVGKTVYLNVLFETLQTDQSLPFGFAPDPETINRVLGTMNAFADGKWVARTPSDYLYLYSARLSLQRPSATRASVRTREYRLEIADVAGEQLAEFVPGERQFSEKTSYYSYAQDSDALFLFIDYPAIQAIPAYKPVQSLSRQVNDLIFVIQSVADAAGIGPTKLLESPVAIIITKCDLALRQQPRNPKDLGGKTPIEYVESVTKNLTTSEGILNETALFANRDAHEELNRLMAVAKARCRWVGLFAVSSVGPFPDASNPPKHIQPINVEAPLMWMLEPRSTSIGKLVRE